MRRARGVFALWVALCGAVWSGWLTPAMAEEPAPVELQELMEIFSRSGGVRARFRETRHVSILTDPIETAGILYFAPPDRLARHVMRPGRSSVVVEGGRVSIGDETGQREFDLESSETAQAIVSNFMIVLRGDLESLQARYSTAFRTNRTGWELDLEPRSRALHAVIERIRFSGAGRIISGVDTYETNGDRTTLTMTDIESGLSWGPRDLGRIFSLDPPDTMP